jgi:hypothetical protein
LTVISNDTYQLTKLIFIKNFFNPIKMSKLIKQANNSCSKLNLKSNISLYIIKQSPLKILISRFANICMGLPILFKIILHFTFIRCYGSTTTSVYFISKGLSFGWVILYTVITLLCVFALVGLLILLKFLKYTCLRRLNIIDEYGDYIEKGIKKTVGGGRRIEITEV